jgi:nitrate/TMAO reductase-like tetraheme cytochrome c subunit
MRLYRILSGSLLIGAVLGIIMTAVVLAGEAAVSTNEFCTSCHSMTYPEKDYGALGANPGCKDCHIPQGLENFHLAVATHIVDGARELYLEFANDYSTLEKFNERRLIMAHDARMNLKKWDSITCC